MKFPKRRDRDDAGFDADLGAAEMRPRPRDHRMVRVSGRQQFMPIGDQSVHRRNTGFVGERCSKGFG
jgi:hypothetical protein